MMDYFKVSGQDLSFNEVNDRIDKGLDKVIKDSEELIKLYDDAIKVFQNKSKKDDLSHLDFVKKSLELERGRFDKKMEERKKPMAEDDYPQFVKNTMTQLAFAPKAYKLYVELMSTVRKEVDTDEFVEYLNYDKYTLDRMNEFYKEARDYNYDKFNSYNYENE